MFNFLKKKQFRPYRVQFESLKKTIKYLCNELESLEYDVKQDIELLKEIQEYRSKLNI